MHSSTKQTFTTAHVKKFRCKQRNISDSPFTPILTSRKRKRVEESQVLQDSNSSRSPVDNETDMFFTLNRGFTAFSSINTLEKARAHLNIEESAAYEARWKKEHILELSKTVDDGLFSTIEEECKDVRSVLTPWIKHTEHDRAKILDRITVNLAKQYDLLLHAERPFSSTYEKTHGKSEFLLSGKHQNYTPLSPIFELKTEISRRNHLGQLLVMLNAVGYVNWSIGFKGIQTIYGILTDVCDWIFVKYDIDTANGTMKDVMYSEKMSFPLMEHGLDRNLCNLINGILHQTNEAAKGKDEKQLVFQNQNMEIEDLRLLKPPNVVTWIASEFSNAKLPANLEEIILEEDIHGEIVEYLDESKWQKLGFPFGTAVRICQRVSALKHRSYLQKRLADRASQNF